MARDRANIRVDMLASTDYRNLTRAAQHLYTHLMIHPTLNYAGVADWRAGRIAALTKDITADDVRAAAKELAAEAFIHCDEDTEEVLIRSYLRHDGVIKHPRLFVSMTNDYAGIASPDIRAYIAHELQRLHKEQPELKLWEDRRVQGILKEQAKDLKAETQEVSQAEAKAMAKPLAKPLAKESQRDPMPTATATATHSSNDECGLASPSEVDHRKAAGHTGTRIPADFKVTPQMLSWAIDNTPNVNTKASTQKFKAHYRSVSGPAQFKTDWTAAWETWLLGDQERATKEPHQFKTAAEKRLEQGRANHDLFAQMDAERENTAREITA